MALLVLTTALCFSAFVLRADSVSATMCGQGTRAIRGSADQVALARRVQQRLHDVERRARWLVAFSEPALESANERVAYDKARTLLAEALDDFRASVANLDRNEMLLIANQIVEQEQQLHDQLPLLLSKTSRRSLDAALTTLQSLAQRLSGAASAGLEQDIGQLEQAAAGQRQRRRILAVLWGLIPAAIIAVVWQLQRSAIGKLTRDFQASDRAPLNEAANLTVAPGLKNLATAMMQCHQRNVKQHRADKMLVMNLLNAMKRPANAIGDTLGQLATETMGELNEAQEILVRDAVAAAAALRKMNEECERYVLAIDGTAAAQPVITHVDMRSVVEDVAATNQTTMESRDLRLNLSLEPVTVVGEARRLRAMVDGLVSNAVSFSPDGAEINIILRSLGDRMKLEVEDDGPGIDDEEREHAFEPFFVGKAAGSSPYYTAGLGLATARECVRFHGGEIEIADPRHPKRGARLRVQLPVQLPLERNAPALG